MLKTVKATIDEKGHVTLTEDITLPHRFAALVTILEEAVPVDEVTLLSEAALGEDWNKPEEDAAWQHLQKPR